METISIYRLFTTDRGLTALTRITPMIRSAQYTMVWNALDYTALVIPTGSHVDDSVDVKKPPHQFYNDLDKANYELCKFEIFYTFL